MRLLAWAGPAMWGPGVGASTELERLEVAGVCSCLLMLVTLAKPRKNKTKKST